MKDQLTLEMLCGYLPYGLKWMFGRTKYNTAWMSSKNLAVINTSGVGELEKFRYVNIPKELKPIFRNPSTDLKREIEYNGERFVPWMRLEQECAEGYNDLVIEWNPFKIGILNKSMGTSQLVQIDIIQQLQKWHFWIYDQSYFDKGLILDINDLKK